MDSSLRRQLAAIKRRALALRKRGEAREREREPGSHARDGADAEGRAVVEAVVETGAVVRGSDFHRLRTLRNRLPRLGWRDHRTAEEIEGDAGKPEGTVNQEWVDPLAEFKGGDPLPIDVVAPGEARIAGGCPFYMVRPVGSAIDLGAPAEAERFTRLGAWPGDVRCSVSGLRRRRGSREQVPEFPFEPEKTLFLDLETAGLSANTYLFLCGLMYVEDGEFVVEQVFARDYEEELGLLRHTRDLVDRFHTVVTFNGASFDLPFLRTRMAIHRLPDMGVFGSVDLLHSSRRVFRDTLPNCRLVTVERHLRGVERTGDIPSRYIPIAYHDFVATGDARAMGPVLYHNRMDLFTMAVIVNRLADRAESIGGLFA